MTTRRLSSTPSNMNNSHDSAWLQRLVLVWRRIRLAEERRLNWSSGWLQGWVFVVIGAVAGGVIGWFTAVHFERESEKDTQQQTRMLTTLLLTAEAQGLVKLARDADGNITGGRVIELTGAAQESQDSTSASGSLTTVSPPTHQ